jgi:hypothetical protein
MAKILDLREESGWLYFRWKGEGWGADSDFKETLTKLKEQIPFDQRTYNPDADHEWGVLAGAGNEAILAGIFSNGGASIVARRSLLKMF